MTRHTRLAPALLALTLWLAPSAASAGDDWDHKGGHGYGHEKHDGKGKGYYGPAALTVRNDFDGTVELWVDGRFMEVLPANCSRTVSMRPGYRDILLRRAETGFVFTRTQLALRPGVNQFLPVAAPLGQMVVQNSGLVGMQLLVDGQRVWVEAGQRVQLAVPTGNVRMTGTVRDPRGDWLALDQQVWLEPGQSGYQTIRPDPGIIAVTNNERFAVRALIDGIDMGYVAPGDTRRIFVRPGPANVVLRDSAGRIRTDAMLNVGRGREERVVLHCQDAGYVSYATPGAPSRPAGPVRPVAGYPRSR
jgi:hypothetical protein